MDVKKAREDLRKGKTIYDMNLNVAYYARVSTDKDDQLNSLENQQKYFEEMIEENKNWKFIEGYVDEGISGTAVKNRRRFLEMVEDASNGKIDLILTKEISRFSRNTVDSIKYTEYLLSQGVIVHFLSDNLNTIGEDSEFRLTIMSSLAQDEVRKLSERVKFGINRMIKERKLIGGNLTGYYKKNGRYEINEKEAPIITYLFETYASGSKGLTQIGLDLAEMGYVNQKGEPYSGTSMAKMLTNARYKGYYTARLSEVENYKTHKKRKLPKEQQIIEKDDRIPAIVSEELWDKANQLHEQRKKRPAYNVLNSQKFMSNAKYSCKMYCKHCGAVYVRSSGGNRQFPVWSCKTYRTKGVGTCSSPIIKELYLDKIFIEIFDTFIKNRNEFISQMIKEYTCIIENNKDDLDIAKIDKEIEQLNKQKDKLLDLSIKGMVSDSEFKSRNDSFNSDIEKLVQKKDVVNTSSCELERLVKKVNDIKLKLNEKIDVKEQLPNLMKLLIERIEIEKLDSSRKNIKVNVYFNFTNDLFIKELNIDETRKTRVEGTNVI